MIHLITAYKTLKFLKKWYTMNQLSVSRSDLQEAFMLWSLSWCQGCEVWRFLGLVCNFTGFSDGPHHPTLPTACKILQPNV